MHLHLGKPSELELVTWQITPPLKFWGHVKLTNFGIFFIGHKIPFPQYAMY